MPELSLKRSPLLPFDSLLSGAITPVMWALPFLALRWIERALFGLGSQLREMCPNTVVLVSWYGPWQSRDPLGTFSENSSQWNFFLFTNKDLPWWCLLSPQRADLQSGKSFGEEERHTSWQPRPRELKRQIHQPSCPPSPCGDPESWPPPSFLPISCHYQPDFLKGYL